MTNPEAALIAVIKHYEEAANTRSPERFREVLALEAPEFTEIEDHIPRPFGSRTAEDILRWIETHPDSHYTVRYTDIQPFILSESIGYAVAMNHWTNGDAEGDGRVTFIFRKQAGAWRILHGHWSNVPESD